MSETNYKKLIEDANENNAEQFAVDNRGYDFFKDDIPFAIDMANCHRKGAKLPSELLLIAIDALGRITVAGDFQSASLATKCLAQIRAMLEGAKK